MKSESPVPFPDFRLDEGIPRLRGTGCPPPGGGADMRRGFGLARFPAAPEAPKGRSAPWTKPKATRRSARHCAGRFRPLKNPWFWKEPRFLRPSDARNAHEICCGIRLWGAERKRVPCGHLGPKGPKRPGGGERNERRARPAPTATIERPGVCPKPRQGDDPPAPRTLSAA